MELEGGGLPEDRVLVALLAVAWGVMISGGQFKSFGVERFPGFNSPHPCQSCH
jgi:hypothetical protein